MSLQRFDNLRQGEHGPEAPVDAVDHRAESIAAAIQRIRDRADHAGIPVDGSLLPLVVEEMGEVYDDGRWQGALEQEENPRDSEE